MDPAPWLLELLVCLKCRCPLTLKEDGSGLRCASCRRVYPIVDGIPVMLLSEAAIEDSDRPASS